MLQIVIADDHRIFREALRELLESRGGVNVVGETDNGAEVVGLVKLKKPDIVLMDVSMPTLNGIDATRQITKTVPGTKVICLSMYGEEHFVRATFEAGAIAYLLKDCTIKELNEALQKAMTGEKYISGSLRINVDEMLQTGADILDSAFGVLTSRERQITQMYAEGATTKEIADKLDVSEKTVGTHRSHLMNKLHIKGIAELTKYAVRQGITKP